METCTGTWTAFPNLRQMAIGWIGWQMEPERHPAQSSHPSKAPEILFAEPWVRQPPRLWPWDAGAQEAGLCHKQQNPVGSLVFLVGTAPGGLLHDPGAFATGSPGMQPLKPSPRAKKGQEIPGADYAAPEGDIKGMQFTGKVPENLGVTVRRMSLNLYFKVDNLIGIIGSFLFIMGARHTVVETARGKHIWEGDNCRSSLQPCK